MGDGVDVGREVGKTTRGAVGTGEAVGAEATIVWALRSIIRASSSSEGPQARANSPGSPNTKITRRLRIYPRAA